MIKMPTLNDKNLHILSYNASSTDSYSIFISPNVIQVFLQKLQSNTKYIIISDSNVSKIYGDRFLNSIKNAGNDCRLITFPAGEEHKNLKTFAQLHEKINLELDRTSCIITLGGGITGDMGGFVASTYMRGIAFIQIPTSLLSMVDASIGGKLGVNTTKGKNTVGLFNNPKAVYIDPLMLRTLPKENWSDGFAEIIKHALLSPNPLLDLIEDYFDNSDSQKEEKLIQIIYQSIAVKLKFVEEDFREMGIRKFLNFGHTIGHALEVFFNYQTISHGQAVALGMIANLQISLNRGYPVQDLLSKTISLCNKSSLETRLDNLNLEIKTEELIEIMKHDKKIVDGKLMLILLEGVGKPREILDITQEEIIKGCQLIV